MLRALVVDDEEPARSELCYLLDEVGDVTVVGEASTAAEAIRLIDRTACDVVFLDIEMPGLSGMRLAEALSLREKAPAIVFVTAYSEHAVKAFEVQAADYLVKPVDVSRLRQAIERIMPAESMLPRIERMPVEKGGRKLLLPVDDIVYVMAKDDYSYVFTDHERYLSTISLAQIEARLAHQGFFRAHRRYVVNLAAVRELVPREGGTMLLTLADRAGTQVPASRRRVPAIKKALGL